MIVQTVTKFLILEHCLSVVLDRLTKAFTPAPIVNCREGVNWALFENAPEYRERILEKNIIVGYLVDNGCPLNELRHNYERIESSMPHFELVK